MSEVLNVTRREERGTGRARQMRRAGQIPAILYGHGKENIALTASADDVATVLRHGSKLLDLRGDVEESALLREVQWDAFGNEVLHLDLTRASATEEVEVNVGIDLRGEAPGVKEGGTVQHQLHEVTIHCPAGAIPEHLEVNINELQVGDVITVADLTIPPGVKLDADPEQIVVQCVEVEQEEDEEAASALPGEPEVIGRKAEDEDGDE